MSTTSEAPLAVQDGASQEGLSIGLEANSKAILTIVSVYGVDENHHLPEIPRRPGKYILCEYNTTFKYSIPDPTGESTISSISKRLLDHVKEVVPSGSYIAFFASDIGGLIVKEALVEASKTYATGYQEIYSRICLLVLFGSPHGSEGLVESVSVLLSLFESETPANGSSPQMLASLAKFQQETARRFDEAEKAYQVISFFQQCSSESAHKQIVPAACAKTLAANEVTVGLDRAHRLLYVPIKVGEEEFWRVQLKDACARKSEVHRVTVNSMDPWFRWERPSSHQTYRNLSESIVARESIQNWCQSPARRKKILCLSLPPLAICHETLGHTIISAIDKNISTNTLLPAVYVYLNLVDIERSSSELEAVPKAYGSLCAQLLFQQPSLLLKLKNQATLEIEETRRSRLLAELEIQLRNQLIHMLSCQSSIARETARETYVVINLDSSCVRGYGFVQVLSAIVDSTDARVTVIILGMPPCQDSSSTSGPLTDASMPILCSEDLTSADNSIALDKDRAEWLQVHKASFHALCSGDAETEALHFLKSAASWSEAEGFLVYLEQTLEQASSPIRLLPFHRHSARSLLTAIHIHGKWLLVALIWIYNATRCLTSEELDEAVSFDLTMGPMTRSLQHTPRLPHLAQSMTARAIMKVLPGAVKIEDGRVYPVDESINQSLMESEILNAVSTSSPSEYLALSCLLQIRYELSRYNDVGPSKASGIDDGRTKKITEYAFRSWVEHFRQSCVADTVGSLEEHKSSSPDARSTLDRLAFEFLNNSADVKKWLGFIHLPAGKWATSDAEESEAEDNILPASLQARLKLTIRKAAWLSSYLAGQSDPSKYYDHLLLKGLEEDDIQLCRAVCSSLKDHKYTLQPETIAQTLLNTSSQANLLLDDTPRTIIPLLGCGMVLYGITSRNQDAIDSNMADRPNHVRYLLRVASQLGDVSLLKKLLERIANPGLAFSDLQRSISCGALPLLDAVEYNQITVVEMLLSMNPPLANDPELGPKALILASKYGFEKMVWVLLNSKITADVNVKDPNLGNTSLHEASKHGFIKTVRTLLKYGADLLLENADQELPVHLALTNGHLMVAECLLDSMPDSQEVSSAKADDGSDTGSVSSGFSVFEFNSDSESDRETSQKSNRQNEYGEGTSLTGGAGSKSDGNKPKSPLNQLTASGISAFQMAAHRGYVALCEKMVSKGANVNIRDVNGGSALHYAALNNSVNLARFLIEKTELDVAAMHSNSQTVTPLNIATYHGHLPMVQFLLESTGNISDLLSNSNSRLLEVAVRQRHLEVLRILTEACLKEQSTHLSLANALCMASTYGYCSIVEYLLDLGVDVNARDGSDRVALHFAAYYDNLKTVELLLLRRTGLDCRDSSGITPTMDAARSGSLNSLKTLINAGADLEITDQDGYSALDLAIKSGNQACGKLLLEKLLQRSPAWHKLSKKLLRPLLQFVVQHSTDLVAETILRNVVENASGGLENISVREFIRSLLWDDWKEAFEYFWNYWDASGLVLGEHGTAVHYAAMRHQPSVTERLITHVKHPAHIESTEGVYGTALQAAISCLPLSSAAVPFLDTLQILVKHHASLDSICKEAMSCAIQAALFHRRTKLVEILLGKLGPLDRIRACGQHGTPLQALLSNPNIHDGHVDDEVENLFHLLLRHGEDCMRESHEICNGVTAVHQAASYASVRIVRLVRDQEGVQMDKPDHVGRLPIHLALRFDRDRWDIIQTMDPQLSTLWEHDKMGRSVLHIAATMGAVNVLQEILEVAKSSHLDAAELLNESDIDGWTPLHWACRQLQHDLVVDFLVKHGADVNKRTREDWLPKHVAIYHGQDDILQFLTPDQETDTGDDGLPSYPMPYTHSICRVCFCDNLGETWNCTTCLDQYDQDSYDLCFKCYHHREKFHPKDHCFEMIEVEEWYDTFQDRRKAALGVSDVFS